METDWEDGLNFSGVPGRSIKILAGAANELVDDSTDLSRQLTSGEITRELTQNAPAIRDSRLRGAVTIVNEPELVAAISGTAGHKRSTSKGLADRDRDAVRLDNYAFDPRSKADWFGEKERPEDEDPHSYASVIRRDVARFVDAFNANPASRLVTRLLVVKDERGVPQSMRDNAKRLIRSELERHLPGNVAAVDEAMSRIIVTEMHEIGEGQQFNSAANFQYAVDRAERHRYEQRERGYVWSDDAIRRIDERLAANLRLSMENIELKDLTAKDVARILQQIDQGDIVLEGKFIWREIAETIAAWRAVSESL
jgi:hypothetical protein